MDAAMHSLRPALYTIESHWRTSALGRFQPVATGRKRPEAVIYYARDVVMHLHMRPFFNAGPRFRASFQNQRLETSGQQVSGCRQAHWTGTDYGDGKVSVIHDQFLLQVG
jgi:hypothetical protein